MREQKRIPAIESLDSRMLLTGFGSVIDAVKFSAEVSPPSPGGVDVDIDGVVSPSDVLHNPDQFDIRPRDK